MDRFACGVEFGPIMMPFFGNRLQVLPVPIFKLFSSSASKLCVAACCSSASSRSRVSRATSVCWPTLEGPLRRTAFGAVRRFTVAAFRRRVLTGSPPALERRLIAPRGSGQGIVSAQTEAPEGARTDFVQLLSKAGSMSALGQKLPRPLTATVSALPPKADTNACWRVSQRGDTVAI
jgi:hypothetical protein